MESFLEFEKPVAELERKITELRTLSDGGDVDVVDEIIRLEKKLDQLLEEFSIAHLRKSPSIALSGGERRRCEIARALASDPTFMLLDEPFAGVDPIAVSDIQQLVRHLTERGLGILITDHNVRETLRIVDRAYLLHQGAVLSEGDSDFLINDPKSKEFYLGEDFNM